MRDSGSGLVESFKECLGGGLPELGSGRRASALPAEEVRRKVDAWLGERGLVGARADLLRGVALLWHDHLEEAHGLAQADAGVDGSFLHAVMHRREPDYWNSKYWWKRVGNHPCFKALAGRVLELLAAGQEVELASHLLPGGRWSPEAFVDACEAVADEPPDAATVVRLREIQGVESEVFSAHLLASC